MLKTLLYKLTLAICFVVLATGCVCKTNRIADNNLTDCRQTVIAQQQQIDDLKAQLLKKEAQEKEITVKMEVLKNKLRSFGVFD